MKNKILTLVLVGLLLISLVPFVSAHFLEEYNEKRNSDGMVCIQVITPAINPANKECKEFSTPCDVPKGWKKVNSCASSSEIDNSKIVNAVDPKTGKCWAFKSSVEVPKGWQILKRIGRAPECELVKDSKAEAEKMPEMLKKVKEDNAKIKKMATKVKECKGKNSGDCKKRFMDFKGDVKNYYDNMLDVIEKQLERLKAKVQNNKGATPEEKALIFSKIEEQIGKVNALREKIRSISDETNKEELMKMHGSVKDFTNEIRHFIKIEKMFLAGSSLRWIDVRLENIAGKIKTSVTNAKEQGKDVSTLDGLVNEFLSHKSNIKDYEGELRKEYAALTETGVDVDELKDVNKAVNEITRKINDELKSAQKILVEIRQELVRLGITINKEGDESEED